MTTEPLTPQELINNLRNCTSMTQSLDLYGAAVATDDKIIVGYSLMRAYAPVHTWVIYPANSQNYPYYADAEIETGHIFTCALTHAEALDAINLGATVRANNNTPNTPEQNDANQTARFDNRNRQAYDDLMMWGNQLSDARSTLRMIRRAVQPPAAAPIDTQRTTTDIKNSIDNLMDMIATLATIAYAAAVEAYTPME